ncbi:MAG: outer membrane beta-barrel protein [Ignavibacteriaceae bacterium]
MSKKSLFKNFLVIFLILFFAVVSTSAQVPGVKVTIGPQIGFQKATDADEGKIMFGAAARVHLIVGLTAEASINYRVESYFNNKVSVKSIPVMISGLIYPLPIIYGVIGAGWYNTKFDYSSDLNLLGINDETKQKFGWHFGAGAEIPLGLNSSNYLTADIRYVFLNYDFKTIPGTGDTNADFYVITVGLQFGLN